MKRPPKEKRQAIHSTKNYPTFNEGELEKLLAEGYTIKESAFITASIRIRQEYEAKGEITVGYSVDGDENEK